MGVDIRRLEKLEESKSLHYGKRYRFEAVTEKNYYEYILRFDFNGKVHFTETVMSYGTVLETKSEFTDIKDSENSIENFIRKKIQENESSS